MRSFGVITTSIAGLILGGCGAAITTEFPNRLIGVDGRAIVLEDIEVITSDPNLTGEEKRSQLRDLGIEDEILIDALLTF